MFPFDIVRIDAKYHWIVFTCNPESDWKWCESHLENLESDPGFSDIMHNIDAYSSFLLSKFNKGSTPNFTILREVRWKKQPITPFVLIKKQNEMMNVRQTTKKII